LGRRAHRILSPLSLSVGRRAQRILSPLSLSLSLSSVPCVVGAVVQ